jgi:hypothetical protein
MARIKGYKAFHSDMTCQGYQYEVGKTYEHEDSICVCSSGFHFCEHIADVFSYYPHEQETIVCEVTALGRVLKDGNKSVTDKIKIGKPIPWSKVHELANQGKENTGLENSGYGNSGYWNSGNWNSGNRNSGYRNSGNVNSGNRNSGNVNSGNRNSGDWNSGDWNSGDWNSGDWNSGNGNAGAFCTGTNKVLMFDEPSNLTLKEWRESKACHLLARVEFITTIWVEESDMTDQEKIDHPEFFCQEGYLKKVNSGYKFTEWWDTLTVDEREVIASIPNFNAEKFKQITGLDVSCL